MIVFDLLIIPLLGALLMAFIGSRPIGAYINTCISLLSFGFAVLLGWQVMHQGPFLVGRDWFYIDAFSAYLIILTTFIGFTTAIFCITYFQNEERKNLQTNNVVLKPNGAGPVLKLNGAGPVLKRNGAGLRIFYSLFQFFLLAMLLVLTTNNLGILWVAMEGATLATVLLISFYRTPAGLEAAWKYLMLGGVGLAQALLGTILLYFAARNLVTTHNALLFTQLSLIGHELSPMLASLAFIFLLVGYGTKAGLVPLHNWLPDAHGEGPAPVSALLSGLLLNIAVYAIVRCQTIIEVATGASFTHHLLMGFGLLSILVAAFFLLRQKEIKRLYAYSSIEHIGLIIFAFGLGAPLAIFAALFHMAMHSLSKTAAFFAAGQAIQYRHHYAITHITGLIQDYPGLGWGLLLSSLALLGMPPFGIFVSEFLIIFATIQQYPWLALPLLIGLLIAFAALFYKVQAMVFTESTLVTKAKKPFELDPAVKPRDFGLIPIYIHMSVVFVLGFWVPAYLTGWLNQMIQLLRGVQ